VAAVWDLGAARAADGDAEGARVAAPAAEAARAAAAGAPPNLVLISIDTLRADHLGCYGYARATSPVLDALARRSLRFADAHAPTPWTLPSHATMLTGRDPLELGILDKSGTLPAGVPTLAEPLRARGYQTAAFVDSGPGGFVGARRGFDRGFDRFSHAPHGAGAGAGEDENDMRRTVDAGLEWLRHRDPSRPFFLFLHTKSVHSQPQGRRGGRHAPYDKPDAYLARFLPGARLRFSWNDAGRAGAGYLREMNKRIARGTLGRDAFPDAKLAELVALYDAGIYYVDEQIGRLLASLAELGLEGDTAVVVTADHGEAFLDHRFFLHQELYHPLIQVPLILRLPDGRRGTVERTVRLADLAPTLLALAGAEPPRELRGRSLLEEGAAAGPRYPFFRLDPSYGYVAYGIEDGPWLLVYHKTDAEPAFRSELVPHAPGAGAPAPGPASESLEAELRERLLRHFGPVIARPLEAGPVDAETLEELRALGYVD
jgi:arylsulfatase A-like enzyme